MRKVLRVDVGAGTATFEDLPPEFELYGGRALTSGYIAREVPATADALGPENKFVIAPGQLAGTTAPNSSRLSVGGKSPLTGGIKEANSGGQAAGKLGRLGIAAIVVQGDPQGRKYVLKITKDGATLEDGSAYWGKANYELADALRAAYGPKVALIQCGLAGERGYKNASVAVTDPQGRPARHAGRGGLGSVMGARGLKAVVIDDDGAPRRQPADADVFEKARKTVVEGVRRHPVSGQGLPNYGTAILVNIINEAGGLPTHNFHEGRFERAEDISGETLHQNAEDRGGQREHGCMTSCIVHCSNVYNDKDGNYLSSGVEYETIWAFGANCDCSDIDAIAAMDRQCDDIGLDTIETGDTFAVAMDGGALPWGDAQAMLKAFDDIRADTDLGRKLANGCVHAGKEFGVTHVPATKGQGMPAYDPRAIKGIGVTYATSTMGADHTSGYAVTANILNVGGTVDPLKAEGQCELSQGLQEATAGLFDSTGVCVFLAFPVLDYPEVLTGIAEMVSGLYGVPWTATEAVDLGRTVLQTERSFNQAAGFTREDDRLPEFFEKEPLPPHNTTWDVADDDLNKVCGWNPVIEMDSRASADE